MQNIKVEKKPLESIALLRGLIVLSVNNSWKDCVQTFMKIVFQNGDSLMRQYLKYWSAAFEEDRQFMKKTSVSNQRILSSFQEAYKEDKDERQKDFTTELKLEDDNRFDFLDTVETRLKVLTQRYIPYKETLNVFNTNYKKNFKISRKI